MRKEIVEVVALPLESEADGDVAQANVAAAPRDSLARLRALEDSSAALAERFATLRDSLNTEVRSLEQLDRRTRAYSLRYAEIRRRTLAAESIRFERDAARSRADSLRSRLGLVAAPPAAGSGTASSPREGSAASDGRRPERRAVTDSTVVFSLAPGRWRIGMARAGAQPSRFETVTVHDGSSDTLHFAAPDVRDR